MIRNLNIKNKNNHSYRVWFLLFLLTLNITFPMGNNFLLKKEYKNKSVVKPESGVITMGNTELVLTLLTSLVGQNVCAQTWIIC